MELLCYQYHVLEYRVSQYTNGFYRYMSSHPVSVTRSLSSDNSVPYCILRPGITAAVDYESAAACFLACEQLSESYERFYM